MAKDIWPQKTLLDIQIRTGLGMKGLKEISAVIVITAVLILLSVYVWPTQWRDLPMKTVRDQQFHQRQNRLTGQVETWIPAGTEKVGGNYVGSEAGTWTKDF